MSKLQRREVSVLLDEIRKNREKEQSSIMLDVQSMYEENDTFSQYDTYTRSPCRNDVCD